MKLRIKGNSLRIRLTRTEVQRLVEYGSVEETTSFADGLMFAYAVRVDAAVNAVSAEYAEARITVTLPAEQAKQWAASDLVGVYGEVATTDGALMLAVEKDFACIDRDEPEDADAFPNPKRDGC